MAAHQKVLLGEIIATLKNGETSRITVYSSGDGVELTRWFGRDSVSWTIHGPACRTPEVWQAEAKNAWPDILHTSIKVAA